MSSADTLSRLLLTLYSAPLDDNQWDAFLTQLCEASGSSSATLMRNDSMLGNRVLITAGQGISSEQRIEYIETFRFTDPVREAFMQNPASGVIEIDDLLTYESFYETEAYQIFLAPSGVRFLTCIAVTVSTRTHEVISLFRKENRRLSPDKLELLQLLLPHLQNALHIRRALGVANAATRDAEDLLDASPAAFFLLDKDGRIIRMNHAAEALMERESALTVVKSRLMVADTSVQAKFRGLLAEAAEAEFGGAKHAFSLPRPGERRPLELLISPLRIKKPGSPIRIVVVASDPEAVPSYPDALLRNSYGLTTAEIDVANALLTGYTVEETARLRCVSVTTVRSQLKSLMSKTQTQRQSDLVRLLLTLPRIHSTL
jgi:DNA-binding CsgD family transcriptional regulator/PAS domain-containing protein